MYMCYNTSSTHYYIWLKIKPGFSDGKIQTLMETPHNGSIQTCN